MREPGFKHSQITIEKIREANKGMFGSLQKNYKKSRKVAIQEKSQSLFK